jgi:Na+/H+ antiporter NhaD/arsenite permease-like protein
MNYIALTIFIITYVGIIFTRLPKINIDRPSAAFFGAVAMIVFGIISFNDAVSAIDFNTIGLLLGMMIIVATLQLDGFFSLIAEKAISYSKDQRKLLFIVVFSTGIASAFLVNDAVVLLFTPVIISICRSSKINPIPYLVAEILSANAGSVMTITGNPQNMLIGINSGIDYAEFFIRLLPVSLISMIIIVYIVRFMYPKNFYFKRPIYYSGEKQNYQYSSMKFSVPIFGMVIIMFFFSKQINLSIPLIALLGASLILIFGKIKPSNVVKQVDWVLLLFFASLFIVVHAFESTGMMKGLLALNFSESTFGNILSLHGISLIMSQIVSNVPYTVLMLPIMKVSGNDFLWLSLASASTLAGNATIIGAMANLIVIESAEKLGVKIKFLEFLKTGIVVTVITLLLSVLIIYVQLFF